MLIDISAITAPSLIQFHDNALSRAGWPKEPQLGSNRGGWGQIETNHRYNSLLWNEEDKARRTDVDASEIATSKRLIDQYNQKRNDAVEAIDEALPRQLEQTMRT